MKKILVIPDSFKGTLSSKTICNIMRERIGAFFPQTEVVTIPVADGGEGSVECFLSAVGGDWISCRAANPYFEEMQAFYGILQGGRTAVVEMAACAGLPLVETRKNPLLTTTYGVGELMLDAAKRGVEEIILGLGGSATNDFGCGAAAALGVKFYNAQGEEFVPVGGTLSQIAKLDVSGIRSELQGVRITLVCDVKNPVYGKTGAAYIYAPQKGASEKDVEVLDEGLRQVCEIVKRDLGKDLSSLMGGGAAGAMAGGMHAFFNATLKMGIEVVLDTVGFDDLLKGADFVLTGEGKLDSQSLAGKVVVGVAQRAKKQGVPTVAVVGGVEENISGVYDLGVSAIFPINRRPEDLAVSRHKSEQNLKETMDDILRLLAALR